jgi:hypothetical protein
MSTDKLMLETRPCHTVLLARLAARPLLNADPVDLPLLQQRVSGCNWKSGHKIAKRKGRVDFALFNIPHR